MKVCTECNIEKEENEFYKRASSKDKLSYKCKDCHKRIQKDNYDIKYHQKYQQDNQDALIEYRKQWHNDNPQYQQQYYQKNQIEIIEYHKQYNQTHKKERSEYHKQWEAQNQEREKVKRKSKYIQKQQIINPDYIPRPSYKQDKILNKFKRQIRILINNSFRKHGYTKKSHAYDLLGCSYADFMTYLGPKPEGDYHKDHICPCSQARTQEEMEKLQHYTNWQWLSATENISKNNHWTSKGEELCKKLLGRNWINE